MLLLIIWLAYEIPSLLLIFWFFLFLNRKEFQYSFYRILQCDMVLNVFCYLNTWTIRMCHVDKTMGLMIWINYNFPVLLKASSFLSYFFYNAQAFSVMTMSIHRLWSSRSTSGNEFWTRNYLRVYFMNILISLVITTPAFFGKFFSIFYYNEETKKFVSSTIEQNKKILFALFFLFQSFIYFLIIFITNIWTICAVKKHFKLRATDSKTKTMMRNLTTIAFINTIVFFIVIIWQLFGGMFLDNVSAELNNIIVMALSDMLSLSLPYCLLIFDRNVRNTIFRLIDDRKMSVRVESIPPVSGGAHSNSVANKSRV